MDFLPIIAIIFYGILFLIPAYIFWLIYALQRNRRYFRKQGVPYAGAQIWQNMKVKCGAMSLKEFEIFNYQQCKKANAPLVATRRSITVVDLDLLKQILVKDADHFVNQRNMGTRAGSKYFSKMLFVLRDEQWKALRAKMTPAFTTGKIKRMYPLFLESSKKMNGFIKNEMDYPDTPSMDVDFCKVFFKYSMDVIGSCAFGVDSHSWSTSLDQLSIFEKFGKQLQCKMGLKDKMKSFLLTAAPRIANLLKVKMSDHEAQEYFAKLIRQVVKHRRQKGERREDFLQLMIDIQEGIVIQNEENPGILESSLRLEFTDEYLIANALMFFLVGFDTTQTVLLFTVYSLALEQEVQEKLYQEVKTTLEKHERKLTYEALSEISYLDAVIYETMRLYPAAPRTERECSQNYDVLETGAKIAKGTMMVVPVHGIHMDPEYYPEPEKFIPERFLPEEKSKRHTFTFIGFGHGPRNCIGMRFAMLKVKAAIAQLISEFKLEVCDKTSVPMKFSAAASAKPAAGMWLKVTARDAK